jgi:hypothetical protein
LRLTRVGVPHPTAQFRHERLGKATGLAVFASDALSSVAYATEEILIILALAGSAALGSPLPIGGAIAVLVVAGALLIDYVLTVAVSVAAGTAAVTSAVPALFPLRVWLCVLAQPAGAAHQGGSPVPPAGDRHGRAISPETRRGHAARS